MDETSHSPPPPPPIPNRPGRVVRIQSIDRLKTESKPNDYVDTSTISCPPKQETPKLPPKLLKPKKTPDPTNESELAQTNEKSQNERNQCRQRVQQSLVVAKKTCSHSYSPKLPPRASVVDDDKPPPLPPKNRDLCKSATMLEGVKGVPSSLLPLHSSTVDGRKHVTQTRRGTTSASDRKLQPAFIIISEQASLPSFFRSLQKYKQNKPFSIKQSSLMPSQNSLQASTASVLPVAAPQSTTIINKQPTSMSDVTLSMNATGVLNNSIICPQCGQCRCSSCTGDRKLPEHYLCEGNCLCSADTVVDSLTCMCCMKSCFQHFLDNPDEEKREPCTCSEPSSRCCVRWTSMAAASVCMPCLCCYWPLRAAVALATKCYNSDCCRTQRGCDCERG